MSISVQPQVGNALIGYVSANENKEKTGGKIPNAVMRDLLQFLENQLGRDALRGVLNLGGMEHYQRGFPANNMRREVDASDYVSVLDGIEAYYDERGATAVMRELGRFTVRRALIHTVGMAEQRGRIFGKELLNTALESFSRSTAVRDRRLILMQDSGDMLLVSVRQPACWVYDSKGRVCEMAAGALRGALEMVSGRQLQVRPIACCNAGSHHCVFEVSRPDR